MTILRHTLVGRCDIHSSAKIREGAVVGKAFRPLLESEGCGEEGLSTTMLAKGVYIGYYSLVGSGTRLMEGVIVDDQCTIECDVVVGERSLVIYRAQICNGAHVGSECVIGGLVAERTRIADRVRSLGRFVHLQHHPDRGWDSDESMERSALVGSGAFVGFGAQVIGPVNLGEECYVCAGAIVTKDVPPGHIAYGVNKVVKPEEWKGALGRSDYFQRSSEGR